MKKFYKQLHVFLMVTLCFALLLSFVACVPDKNDDDMDYNEAQKIYQFSESDNQITITKYIDSAFQVEIPSSIGGRTVVAIGDNAFSWKEITSVTIPHTVKSIGNHAFGGCQSLTTVTFKTGSQLTTLDDRVFYNCENLTNITIPNSVTKIGGWIFCECDSLTSIVIPDSVTSLGYAAFFSCDNLTVYCEAQSQPSTWQDTWKIGDRPVYWYSKNQPTADGNYWHYVDGIVTKW